MRNIILIILFYTIAVRFAFINSHPNINAEEYERFAYSNIEYNKQFPYKVSEYPWYSIIGKFLYTPVEFIFYKIFGLNPVSLRFINVLSNIALIILFYYFFRKNKDDFITLYLTAFLAVIPIHIAWSRSAASAYMFQFFLGAVSVALCYQYYRYKNIFILIFAFCLIVYNSIIHMAILIFYLSLIPLLLYIFFMSDFKSTLKKHFFILYSFIFIIFLCVIVFVYFQFHTILTMNFKIHSLTFYKDLLKTIYSQSYFVVDILSGDRKSVV